MKRALITFIVSVIAVAAVAFFVSQNVSANMGTTAFNTNHNCRYCHALHGGNGPSLLVDTDVEVLCMTCHGAAGSSPWKAEVHTNENERRSDYDPFYWTCTVCHDPHTEFDNWLGGVNIRLTGTELDASGFARIQTPNSGIREVVFESRGTTVGDPLLHSFADGDEDGNGYYDGICETCHTLTGNHSNDVNTSNHNHNRGKTCTANCHPHTNYFLR